jgi:hypothetical protein
MLGDVAGECACLSAALNDCLRHSHARRGIDVEYCDFRAFLTKSPACSAANSAATASHNHNLVLQSAHASYLCAPDDMTIPCYICSRG